MIFELLNNIDRLHTTELGYKRINNNLCLKDSDPVKYCIGIITDNNSSFYKKGKNWYCENKNIRITINASNYTIITAHFIS